MSDFLLWLLTIEALGLAALPLVWTALPTRPLCAVACARPLGLLLVGLIAWAGPIAGIYAYSRGLALAAAAAVALLTWGGWGRGLIGALRGLARGDIARLCVPEIVFAGAAAWQLFMVSLNPSVYRSEIPMNFAFVNVINRSQWFPPSDPWLAGYPINYYYFGHFLVALLIRLSGVEPAVGFNLAGVTLFASVVTLIFMIVVETIVLQSSRRPRFVPSALAGLAAVGMALFNGNLAPLYRMIHEPAILGSWWSRGEQDWSRLPYHSHGELSELPWRTYLLHYTHSFDMALPFLLVLFVWGMHGWSLGRPAAAQPSWGDASDQPVAAGARSRAAAFWISLVALWAGISLISPWVLPAAGLLLGGLALQGLLRVVVGNRAHKPALARRTVVELTGWMGALIAGTLLLRLFVPQYWPIAPSGLLHIDTASAAQAISLRVLLLQDAVPLAGATLIAIGYIRALRLQIWAGGALALCGLAALWLGVSAAIWLLLCSLLLLAVVAHALRQGDVRFSLLLLLIATTLNALPFFVAVHDTPNTLFKFGFLAWIIFAMGLLAELSSPRPRESRRQRWAGRAALAGVAGALFAGAWMPALAAVTSTNWLRGWGIQTLDGAYFYLQRSAPGEYEAVRWLNNQANSHAVLLEMTAPGFTPASRMSVLTGLPTVVGWYTHEAFWHEGQPGVLQDIERRVSDVHRVYETLDPAEAECLLQRYNVTYVVVGDLERKQTLPDGAVEQRAAALAKFGRFMDIVYPPTGSARAGDVTIFQRRVGSDVACLSARDTAGR